MMPVLARIMFGRNCLNELFIKNLKLLTKREKSKN